MPIDIHPVTLAVILEFFAVIVHIGVIGSVLLSRRRDPSATLAWILFVVLAPVIGVIAYLTIGRTRMRRTVRRSGRAEERVRRILSRHDVHNRLLEPGDGTMDPRTASQIALGNAMASTPASQGNAARVLNGAAATYREIIRALEGATDHIHVEFYIIQPDMVGTSLRDRLARRAAAGIEVRVLCDAVGSMGLPLDFWAPLQNAGGTVSYFSPVLRFFTRLRRRDRVDFRNHRKIVVADGRVGFTGGINVGKEYLGLDPNIGEWRDTHIRIEGPAALSLQQAFLQDWLLTTGEALDGERYFPNCGEQGECVVQVIDSGPDQRWAAMELYYAQAIALARERVWITNPYFIPSRPIAAALTVAALKGMDVRLLLPAKSDNMLVRQASRSYYEELLAAGVRVFEYERGFVHAKTMVVDRWVATVGSANMDMRSFNLNFELNAFIFGEAVCRDIADRFRDDLRRSTEVTYERERNTRLPKRLVRSVARLLSPLM